MKDKFKEWSCSFSGCDGGNLNADVWLCGIEWGQGSYGGYYEKELPEEISKGAVENPANTFDWKDSLTYRYGLSFAKLYTVIKGGKIDDYRNVGDLSGNELFKANLYPIAFDSTDSRLWHEYGLDHVTGFGNKYEFNTWCFFNRFGKFAELRKQHNPKLIICTGVDYLRDFIMFFNGANDFVSMETIFLENKGSTDNAVRRMYAVRLDSNSLLVVLPFFSGRYGLNSNVLISEAADQIRSLLMNSSKDTNDDVI